MIPNLFRTHRWVRLLWEISRESCTSVSQSRMMSRLAMTQSPPHREFLREVGCALFSLPLPTWHLPAGGSLGEPFEEALVPKLGGQIRLILTGQVGEGGWRKLRPAACPFNCLKIIFPYSLLCHRGAFFCHYEDYVCSLTQSDARQDLWLSCLCFWAATCLTERSLVAFEDWRRK